jgi:hypothetical protein
MISYKEKLKNQKLSDGTSAMRGRPDLCKLCEKKLFPEERRVGHVLCYECRNEKRDKRYEE